jgi:hypothetical protein
LTDPIPLRPHHLRYFIGTNPEELSKLYGEKATEAMLCYLSQIPRDAEVILSGYYDELCSICEADDPPCPSPLQEKEIAKELGLEMGKPYPLSKLLDKIRT